MPRCTARKNDGEQCNGRAPEGRTHCWFHDAASAAQRDEGRRQGGRTRLQPVAVLGPDTPDLQLQSVSDVVTLLGQTINQVRRGEIGTKPGNCIALLASTLLRAIQGADLEERIRALEEQLLHRGAHNRNGSMA